MVLYVIRHGEVKANLKNQINGRNNHGLTFKGKKQAKDLQQIIKNLKINVVFCSPLKRAKQTCKIATKNKYKIIYDNRLLERDTRSMQYKPIEILKKNKVIWYDCNKNIIYKNSEGFKSIISRVNNFIENLKLNYKNKNILIVTHGDICCAFHLYFNPEKNIANFEQKNCEIVKYTLKEDFEHDT